MKRTLRIGTIALVAVVSFVALLLLPKFEHRWQKQDRLLAAVWDNDLETIAALREELGDPDGRSDLGDTAMHEAARLGRIEVLDYLLLNGANIDVRDGRQQTPLHVAIRNVAASRTGRHVDYGLQPTDEGLTVVRLLLDHGAGLDVVDADGKTPRDWAESLRYPMVTDLLDTVMLTQ